MNKRAKYSQRELARERLRRMVHGSTSDREAVRVELAKEVHHRKVKKRTAVGFWAALAFIVAFILGCWVVS